MHAQVFPEIPFKNFTINNGLSTNNIQNVFKNKKGLLWLSADNGLIQFDGLNSKLFVKDEKDSLSFNGELCTNVLEDKKNNLWIGTGNAMLYYNSISNKFKSYTYKTDQNKQEWNFPSYIDDKNNLWFFSASAFKICYRNLYTNVVTETKYVCNTRFICNQQVQGKSPLFFVGKSTTSGVSIFFVKENNIISYQSFFNGQNTLFPKAKIDDNFYVDKDNMVWCGSDIGLIKFNPLTKQFFIYNHFKNLKIDDLNTPTNLLNNYIVVGSNNNGLFIFDKQKNEFVKNFRHIENDPLSIISNNITKTITDEQGKIYCVSPGEGLSIGSYQNSNYHYSFSKQFILENNFNSNNIEKIISLKNNDFLFLNKEQKLFISTDSINQISTSTLASVIYKTINNNKIYFLKKENETIFIYCNKTIYIFNENNYSVNKIVFNNIPKDIVKIGMQDFVITVSDNFYNLVIKNNTWQIDKINALNDVGPTSNLFCIYNGANNNLYVFGEFGGYIAILKKINNTWVFVKDCWLNCLCNSSTLLNNGNILATSNGALIEIDKDSLTHKTILPNLLNSIDLKLLTPVGNNTFLAIKNESLVLIDNNNESINSISNLLPTFTTNAINTYSYNKIDSVLLIGLKNGIIKYKFPQKKISTSTSIFLHQILINEQPLQINVAFDSFDNFELPNNTNTSDFYFSTLNYTFNKNFDSVKYQLQPGNNLWSALPENGIIHFSTLNNNNYTLIIKNKNQIIRTIHFKVLPTIFQSNWFKLLIFLLLALIGFMVIKWRINTAKNLEKQKTEIQILKANELQHQLEQEKITNYFSTSMLHINSIDEVLWDVAQNLISKLGFVDCMIYQWNDNHTKMVQKAGYGPKASDDEIMNMPFDVTPGQGVIGYVMQNKEAVIINDTSKDSRYRMDKINRLSEICVPILQNNNLIGVIDSEHPNLNFYTQNHLQILTNIATLTANKIASIDALQLLKKNQEELFNTNQLLKSAQLDALRSQMNPHFIFNSLNSIENYVLKNDRLKASEYLTKFSKLIRLILDNSKCDMVSISKEIETVKLYIDLEQLRMNNNFDCTLQIDDELLDELYSIPPMLIQPYLENAILHGLRFKETGRGKIFISLQLASDSTLIYIIEDNGIGREKAKELKQQQFLAHRSYGTEITKNRLEMYNQKYNLTSSVKIIDLKDNENNSIGTRVEVRLPIVFEK